MPGAVVDLIGRTPLARLNAIPHKDGCLSEVLAKLEYFNPGSSVKDRLAKAMIDDAEKDGRLRPGTLSASGARQTIVEPTSGNTGIGLALVAAVRAYDLILTMPESMSRERKILLAGLGAKLVLTPAAKGMAGAVAEAERLAAEKGAVILRQFENPAGPRVHALHTAQEIWDETKGLIDVVVAGIGTGGTVTGLGRRLKELRRDIRVYGVEPAESAVLSGGAPGPHLIQGIGAGFVPKILDLSVIDGIIAVPGQKALETTRRLLREEGLFCGISSGAAAFAALELAKRKEYSGLRIVFIAPDTAERYLSTALFEDCGQNGAPER